MVTLFSKGVRKMMKEIKKEATTFRRTGIPASSYMEINSLVLIPAGYEGTGPTKGLAVIQLGYPIPWRGLSFSSAMNQDCNESRPCNRLHDLGNSLKVRILLAGSPSSHDERILLVRKEKEF